MASVATARSRPWCSTVRSYAECLKGALLQCTSRDTANECEDPSVMFHESATSRKF